LKKILKLSLFNLNTYVIGGPENIQERHLLSSETKSEALVRFVDIFSSLGLDVFQLRFKNSSDDDFLKLAIEIVRVLKNTNCKLCINDNVKVVNKLSNNVDILHIGQNDMEPQLAKKKINSNIKIGLSITGFDQIQNIPDFINYIGVGPVFPTNSKTDASNAMGEVILEEIVKKVDIPVVAIGGIKLKNINKLKSMGVSGFAMISEIFSSIDPEKKFKEFKKLAK
tara:strand:- start:275 stop:949 length:675 start_codon:yes stop_codon:yes gene_type:complete